MALRRLIFVLSCLVAFANPASAADAPSAFTSIAASRVGQSGKVPEGAAQPDGFVLANEPEGASAGIAAGQRKLRLEVRFTGKPVFYEVYGTPAVGSTMAPTLEIASPAGWSDDWEQRVAPVTSGPAVYREACLPLAEKPGEEVTMRLLYPAKKIIEVIANATGERLAEGRDWNLHEGKLILRPGAHAPIQLAPEFFATPQKGKDGTVKITRASVRLNAQRVLEVLAP